MYQTCVKYSSSLDDIFKCSFSCNVGDKVIPNGIDPVKLIFKQESQNCEFPDYLSESCITREEKPSINVHIYNTH